MNIKLSLRIAPLATHLSLNLGRLQAFLISQDLGSRFASTPYKSCDQLFGSMHSTPQLLNKV